MEIPQRCIIHDNNRFHEKEQSKDCDYTTTKYDALFLHIICDAIHYNTLKAIELLIQNTKMKKQKMGKCDGVYKVVFVLANLF